MTVAPLVNPDTVQENQPNGVSSPSGIPPGAETGEKFENVPALVETASLPCDVTTLQVAPLQVAVAVVGLL